MNQPIETYTFSRALHLMRYGGKKMACLNYSKTSYLFVHKNELMCSWNGEHVIIGDDNIADYLGSDEIMGEWVEVK